MAEIYMMPPRGGDVREIGGRLYRGVDGQKLPVLLGHHVTLAANGWEEYGPVNADQDTEIQSLVSGAGTVVAASRAITADDNGQSLRPTGSLTLTIPAGLSPMPSFTLDCPATGTVSIAVSGGATINGAATTLTRTRASNPVGFVVLAHESDAYGVSGA